MVKGHPRAARRVRRLHRMHRHDDRGLTQRPRPAAAVVRAAPLRHRRAAARGPNDAGRLADYTHARLGEMGGTRSATSTLSRSYCGRRRPRSSPVGCWRPTTAGATSCACRGSVVGQIDAFIADLRSAVRVEAAARPMTRWRRAFTRQPRRRSMPALNGPPDLRPPRDPAPIRPPHHEVEYQGWHYDQAAPGRSGQLARPRPGPRTGGHGVAVGLLLADLAQPLTATVQLDSVVRSPSGQRRPRPPGRAAPHPDQVRRGRPAGPHLPRHRRAMGRLRPGHAAS